MVEEKSLFSSAETTLSENFVGGIPYPKTKYFHLPNS